MAAKSILDLDEARTRLTQMLEDQKELGELISRLKAVQDRLAAALKEADEQRGESTAQLKELQESSERLGRTAVELETRADKAIVAVEVARQSYENKVSVFLTRKEAEIDQALEAFQAEQARWAEKQDQRFEEFREQHYAGLDEVSKSYERMRIIYDGMKQRTEGLEAEIQGSPEKIKATVDAAQEENEQRLRRSLTTLGSALRDNVVSVKKEMYEQLRQMEQGLDTMFETHGQRLALLKQQVQGLEKRFAANLVVIPIISAVLGTLFGILLAYVIGIAS